MYKKYGLKAVTSDWEYSKVLKSLEREEEKDNTKEIPHSKLSS